MSDNCSILNQIDYPIVIINNNGTIKFANEKFKDVFCKNKSFPATTRDIFHDKNEHERFLSILESNSSKINKINLFFHGYNSDNLYFVHVSFNENEKIISFYDAQKYVFQEKRLNLLNQKYLDLLTATKTGYVILDENLIIKECNDILTKTLQMEENSLVGENIKSILGDEIKEQAEIFTCNLLSLFKNNKAEMKELDIKIRGNNTIKWVSVKINKFGEKQVACLFHDITNKKNEEHKKYIKQQKQKDKMLQNLEKIRNGMVHESSVI